MSALTDVFTAIANAIRSKNGLATTYKPNQMAQAISEISTGVEKKAEGFLLGALGVFIAINDTGDKFALNYPFGAYLARSIVYNNLGGLDDFLIGLTNTNSPLVRCLTDGTIQAITLSGFTGQIMKIRKYDTGSYTNVPKIYMGTNQNNKIIHSVNGNTFTVETMSGTGIGSTTIRDIAYSSFDNKLVAVQGSDSARSYLLYRSGNGASNSWSTVNIASTITPTGIAYGHRHFILIGKEGKIQYSTDGTTWWNLSQSYTTADLNTIEYVDEWSAFIIGYNGGTLIIEINAQSTSRTLSNKTITGGTVYGIAYHKQLDMVVAICRKSTSELLYATLDSLSSEWVVDSISSGTPNAIAFK